MHQLKLAISCNPPYHVAKAYCSCVTGCSGMCSHIVGLLKQLIYYAMMKQKSVHVDLTYIQIQQSWHKPRPTEIESVPVMNVSFCKAKQSEAIRNPVTCILFEAHAKFLQEYIYMLNKNTLGVKKVRGQSEAALQTGATKNFDIS